MHEGLLDGGPFCLPIWLMNRLLLVLLAIGLAGLCLFGAFQKLRDGSATYGHGSLWNGFRMWQASKDRDGVGFWSGVCVNLLLAFIFLLCGGVVAFGAPIE